MASSLKASLPRDPTAAGLARQLISERLGPALDEPELDAARTVVSELVNNAVLHGRGEITLKADIDGQRLRIEVVDEGGGFEYELREIGFETVGGRGLELVDALASRWGVHEGTTHVWVELERPGPRLGEHAE